MARVCGREPKEIAMSGSGAAEKPMVMECIIGSTAIATKDNLDRI